MARIEAVEVTPVRVPLNRPMGAAGRTFRFRDYLLVSVRCDDGSLGIGFSYVATGGGRAAAMATEELLVPQVLGGDPIAVESLWRRMYRETLILGRAGLVMNGLSAIDIALWDRNARAAGVPLFRHLGSDRTSVPAYASGGYYAPEKGPRQLAEEVAGYAAMGFKAFKIKTGALGVAEEEARLAAVREVIGADGVLMLDAYNAWNDLATAWPYIEMFRRYRPFWIEDPFPPDNVDDYARLARRIPEPIAAGEFYIGLQAFKTLIEKGAAQILQAEAPRTGGISEWRRIATFAAAHGIAMCPCWFHDIHAHLVASASNGLYVEVFPDDTVLNFRRLIDHQLELRDGALVLPERPGLGFEFLEAAVAEYALA